MNTGVYGKTRDIFKDANYNESKLYAEEVQLKHESFF